jgi:uncharacterized membrane protein
MKSNLFDRIAAILAIVILLAGTAFVLINWSKMPEQIPSHYDFKGQPDGYGGKGTLIFLMAAGWVLVPMMMVLSKFPQFYNTGVERTPANEAVINRITRDLISFMELAISILFTYMMVVPVIGANMGAWFMPVFLALIFGSIIVTVVRLIRNR